MATYNDIFGSAATSIGFESEEEKKKKRLLPSQTARTEQKATSYEKVFGKAVTSVQEIRAKQPPEVTPPAPTVPAIVEKPKKTLLQKVGGAIQQFLFGTPKEEAEAPVVDRHPLVVGKVEEARQQAISELADVDKQRQALKLNKRAADRFDPMLDLQANSLKWAIKDYDAWLGKESSNRGIFKEITESWQKIDPLNFWYKEQAATKTGQALIKYKNNEELSPEEQRWVNIYRSQQYAKEIKNGAAEIFADFSVNLVGFGVSLAAAGKVAEPVIGRLAQAALKLPTPILKKVAPALLNNSVKLAIASQINFPELDRKTAEYMLPTVDYEQALGGDKDILNYLGKPLTRERAEKKARIDNLINYVSEGVGGYIDDALPFVKKAFIGKWLANKGIPADRPDLVRKALQKISFTGLAGEVIEEEVAEPFLSVNEERKYYDPFFTPEGRERLLTETLLIGGFTGVSKVSDTVLNTALTRHKKNDDKITIEPTEKAPAPAVPLPPVIQEEMKKAAAKSFTGIAGMENINKYVSAEDFAKAEFEAKPEHQLGTLPAKEIVARDPIDRAQVDRVKADIEAGKPIEPIEIAHQDGKLTTVDGSQRLTAFQELGKPVPVIFRGEETIGGLTKINEIYRQGVPVKIEKPAPGPKEVVPQPKEVQKPVEVPPETEIIKGQDIKDLDAQIRTIKEPTDEFPKWEVEIGLQESLGEQGGDIITLSYEEKPTLAEIRNDIIEEYKQVKTEINKEVAVGVIAKSGRDEMIEKAINKVLAVVEGKGIKPTEVEAKVRLTPEKEAALKKVVSRKSPLDIKGMGKSANSYTQITDNPNAYTDGFVLLTDRTPEEVKSWNEALTKFDKYTRKITMEDVKSVVAKSIEGKTKLENPVDFEKGTMGQPDRVDFRLANGRTVAVNAEAWKWLAKQGYELYTSESLGPITLYRNGQISGAFMPIRTSEAEEYAKIKPSEEKPKAGEGAGRVAGPGQPAGPVPEGKAEQAGTGEAVEVPVGEAPREREGGGAGVGERPRTRIEEEVPINVIEEADRDWIENYAETYVAEKDSKKQAALEEAFINKWRKKSVETPKATIPSKKQQVEINRRIEKLIEEKEDSSYTEAEKDLLRQYTGAGGLEAAGAEGRGLLDEYYTPKPIVDFMWEKVKGITKIDKDTTILEPSAGIGNFLEEAVKTAKYVVGHEINETAAIIAGILYPKASISVRPFERNFIDFRGEKVKPQVIWDLVIGNPPYGEHRGKFLGLGEEPKIPKYEEYFIKRGLDVLKKDGILTYVVPSGFLRSGSNYAKEQIAKTGQLIDAYRLPNGVFGTTSIGTDMIFIKKVGEVPLGQQILRKQWLSDDLWFRDPMNAKKILGEVAVGVGRYGGTEVRGTLERAIDKAIQADLSQPKEIADTITEEEVVENEKEIDQELAESKPRHKTSIIEYPSGKFGFVGTIPTELTVINEKRSFAGAERKSMIFETREEAESVLAKYNEKFKKTPPVRRTPQNPTIVNALNKKAILIPAKKDTTIRLSEVSDDDFKLWQAVSVTGELTGEYTGGFDPKVFVSDKVAIEFDTNTPKYYPNIVYYQGDIYEKLDNLELSRHKISPKQYEIQKKKLEAVLPPKQTIATIQLQPNSDFVKETTVTDEERKDIHLIDLFESYYRSLPYDAFGASNSWEVTQYINGTVVNTGDKLRNIEVRKRRRVVGNALFRRFLLESLTPEQQQLVADKYNRVLNAYYRPDYKSVPILSEVNSVFNPQRKPGKHLLDVFPHQKEGAAFLATKGAGLLGYDVGLGKTMTAIIAVNDVLKRGWAKKPLIIVPNAVYQNWINEISEIMPDVKINLLNNLGGAFRGDLKTLEIEDGTLSIITYDGLVKLGFKPETYKELTADLKDVMLGMNNTKRATEKQAANVEQQIGRAIKGTTGDRFFEDLGFDHITIDEVHNFKNIFAGAKMERGQRNEYQNVRGSSSARGIKAYLMAQYVLKNNNNRNVFLLSATPFTNSPMEIYSILSLMGKKRLERLGLKNVNDFMSFFMDLKSTFVVKADQSVKEEDLIEKFQNLQQMQKLITEFIDFRTGEEIGIDRPGKIKRTVTLSPTSLQNKYISQAQALFEDKEKGGAIVAITELQNITLSPYLSRYSRKAPTYREFVENSPKIKFAVEALTQTYKDNPKVSQIVYMPRGVEKFDLLKEYLVKEKGFKNSQIGIITGGMSIDARQKIQDEFNHGTVKVLIGTEAIKEGVNLQERSTDMYHLHLPWNPTDMLQAEGRIWRQGNGWANVRIHYPLIENSVDSFIFQKLETKEKRIKNLWSYKGDEIEVGDLDFENMKLDLISNPVIRVRAEKTFETRKEEQKLEQLKVERAFISRRIEKLETAEEELKESKERLADAEKTAAEDIESFEAKNLKKYRESVSRKTANLTAIKRDYQQRGIDVAGLSEKLKEFDKEIETQEKVVEELDTKFATKVKEAEKQEEKLVSKPNNYAVMVKQIANENATFFRKRAGQDRVRAADTTYTTPAGAADIGGYGDVESATKTVEGIKAVEFPELLRLSQELSGETPTLKRFRRALGRFYSVNKGIIKLHPDIFKDPKLASKVFAHELGHLADYLPDKTLVRGNILGRIASLNKFLRGRFGEKEINNADIRSELKDLSQAWKPFNELENPNFTSYRFSSKELYADAISVLFNDPALLKEKAPLFFEAFFDNLESKPEVKTEFDNTWNLLNAGEDAVFRARYEAIDKGYKRADEAWAAKSMEKAKMKTNIFQMLRVLFDDRNHELNRRVKEQLRSGMKIEDQLNPMYAFAGLNYLDGKLKNFVADNFQPAFVKAAEVSNGWDDLGQILQMERTINERGDLANPGGFDKLTAETQLKQLEKHTDPADWAKLQEAKNLFREGVQATVKLAEQNGYYKPEMIDQMKANPAYATYQVIDYLDTYISASIKKQVGTLKNVANPATATVMKAISTMKAIEFNNARKAGIDFTRDFYKEELKPAKTFWNGKFHEIIDSKSPDEGTVVIIRNGVAEGYYIPKDLAEVLNHTSSSSIMMASKISRWLTGSSFYRPVFTTVNFGFQTFNFVRDFMRYWKNIPDFTLRDALTSFPRALVRYAQAAPHALNRVLSKPDNLIKEMENAKILGLTFNDLFHNPDEIDQKQIERVMQKAGVLQATRKRNLIATPFHWLFRGLEEAGNFIETLPKVAGYIELKGKMPENELADFIRKYVGSPSFRTQGTLTPISNNIFLFSNAYKEGIKSDMQIATNYITTSGYRTRAAFWWKTMLATILPKALMVAAAAGLLGEWWKKKMDDASEYDKTNYNILPLGEDENGKSVLMRIPQDETGRFIGGLFWKMSKFMTKGDKVGLADAFQVVDFGAGQVPNMVPSITGAGAILTYLSGKNPYDTFRGRNVIPDEEFNAGPKYSFPIFMDWLIKNQGLGIIMPSYTPEGDLTGLQKLVSAPVLSNILGRWVKVTDQGQREKLQEVKRETVKEEAKVRVEEKRKIDKAIKEYKAGTQNMTRRREIERELIKDVLGERPYNKEQVADAKRLIKKFKLGLLKGEADQQVNAVISATSNEQKVKVLLEIRKTKSTDEFRDLLKLLLREKVISSDVIVKVRRTSE